MTTLAAPSAARSRPAPALPGYRFELLKLTAQWRTRALLLVGWLGPGVLVAAISRQSTLPTDTVFGRWMGQSGWAGPLVVLSFCCSWVLPLATSLVAGDVFAAEDRLGTWRHLLTVVGSPRRIFTTKALAAATVLLVVVLGLAVSSTAGGLLAVGPHPLVGLDGHLLGPARAGATVLLAWAAVLAPTAAFAAVGLLGSVVFGRSPVGLLLPALLALVLQLVQLLPLPVVVRAALPGFAFTAWHGLFTSPAQTTPLLLGVGVALAWAVLATALARHLFLRRDFTGPAHDGSGAGVAVRAVLPPVGLLAATIGLLAATTPVTGAGVTGPQLETSLATSYAHLYRLQTRELGRPDVPEAQLRTGATCDKGGDRVEDSGPGNDWRCVVSWHIPGATATGSAVYQLDVTADGRYVADGDGPQTVNGFFPVPTVTGPGPNPLWQFDGSVDLLATTTKG
ncbi:ABC transporter permease [Kineococcus rhizosphaerae]|uniref:ABC-2 type transport system permease protein n=1 Tax=Kineococcus rhizosphaerae TaxID=559628 RepID=A0A2T0R0I7_9ACTN|nr:ABC transporter permease [Kineococcus rhizosphaerae]PRY12824.1 ABC-2 type transport system permease protein [Kineococcus rhizosphaerae]